MSAHPDVLVVAGVSWALLPGMLVPQEPLGAWGCGSPWHVGIWAVETQRWFQYQVSLPGMLRLGAQLAGGGTS